MISFRFFLSPFVYPFDSPTFPGLPPTFFECLFGLFSLQRKYIRHSDSNPHTYLLATPALIFIRIPTVVFIPGSLFSHWFMDSVSGIHLVLYPRALSPPAGWAGVAFSPMTILMSNNRGNPVVCLVEGQ